MSENGENLKEKVISLCADYLNSIWRTVEPEKIVCTKIDCGAANSTIYCSIKNYEIDKDIGPKEVIVHLYGNDLVADKDAFKFNGEAAEGVIVERLASLGMAPKVLGVFRGGRIEEYIPSKVATVSDTKDIEFCKAIIRKIAKFHTLSLPICKTPNLTELILCETEFTKSVDDLKSYTSKQKPWVFDVINFSIEKEKQWFEMVVPKICNRVVCCHNDINLNNVLIKNEYSSNDDRILLIDYEMVRYYYRGYDLAYFLRMKDMQLITEPNNLNVKLEPSDEKMRDVLLHEYLREYKKVSTDFGSKHDNFQHLSMELDLFDLMFDVSFISWVKAAVIEQNYGLPLEHVSGLVCKYNAKKDLLIRKYGNPEKWE